jgi:hypothetical protein
MQQPGLITLAVFAGLVYAKAGFVAATPEQSPLWVKYGSAANACQWDKAEVSSLRKSMPAS